MYNTTHIVVLRKLSGDSIDIRTIHHLNACRFAKIYVIGKAYSVHNIILKVVLNVTFINDTVRISVTIVL